MVLDMHIEITRCKLYSRYRWKQFCLDIMQEVSRVRSTKRSRNPKLYEPFGKEQIHQEKLNPFYVPGFIDGEGSFSVSVGRHKTLSRGIEVRPEFEIELRADDREILERVLVTIGAGKIYDCSYERYGWYPHVKYKITSTKEWKNFYSHFLTATRFRQRKQKHMDISGKLS